MDWIILVLAGLFEVGWAVGLKLVTPSGAPQPDQVVVEANASNRRNVRPRPSPDKPGRVRIAPPTA
jgi:hypothetical protein